MKRLPSREQPLGGDAHQQESLEGEEDVADWVPEVREHDDVPLLLDVAQMEDQGRYIEDVHHCQGDQGVMECSLHAGLDQDQDDPQVAEHP